MNHNEEKHKQLNEFGREMRLKAHEAQVMEYEILSDEISKLQERIKWARFIFIIIFAFGMFVGIVTTSVLTFINSHDFAANTIPTIGSGAAFAPELALYQTITNPMQSSIGDLDKRRRDVSMSWIKDKEGIARRLSEENKILTEYLTQKKSDE